MSEVSIDKMGTKREGGRRGGGFSDMVFSTSSINFCDLLMLFKLPLDFLVFLVSHVIGGSILQLTPFRLNGWSADGVMSQIRRRGLIKY